MTSQKGASPIAINNQLWLASASPRRLDLLAQLGITPARIMLADIDEAVQKSERARDYVQRLARAKAEAIRHQSEETEVMILAADTAVAIGRRILPKAETEAQAAYCLNMLSGRAHRVYTAIYLSINGEKNMDKIVSTRLIFKRLSEQDKNDYLASGEWQGKAGGYAIQGRAGAFIRRINGSYSGVVGLPLYETANLLRSAGLCILGE